MTRNELITLLLSMPGENPKVALVDLNKNLAAYTGSKEVPTDGLYERFKVQSGGKGPEDVGIFILFETTEYYAVNPDIHEVK